MTTYLSPQHLEISGYVSLDRLEREAENEEENESWRGRRGGYRPRRPSVWPLPRRRRRRRTYVRNLIWGADACPCVYNNGRATDAAADSEPQDAPADEPQDEIVARTSDELYEMLDEVQRAFQAQVKWTHPIALANAGQLPSAPGVYMVLKGGKPLYVGQSNNVRQRWLGRLQTLTQLAVDTSAYRIKMGTINPTGTEKRGATNASLRRDVEAGLITTTPGLTNRSSFVPFKVKAGGVQLAQQGPRGGTRQRSGSVGKIFREW